MSDKMWTEFRNTSERVGDYIASLKAENERLRNRMRGMAEEIRSTPHEDWNYARVYGWGTALLLAVNPVSAPESEMSWLKEALVTLEEMGWKPTLHVGSGVWSARKGLYQVIARVHLPDSAAVEDLIELAKNVEGAPYVSAAKPNTIFDHIECWASQITGLENAPLETLRKKAEEMRRVAELHRGKENEQ